MNMKKQFCQIMVITILISSLAVLPGLQPVTATQDTGVTRDVVYDHNGAYCGQYGFSTAYAASSGGPEAYFWPTLEVETNGEDDGWGLYNYVKLTKIEVTGEKPNGEPLQPVQNFGDMAVLESPHNSGTQWEGALTAVWMVLKSFDETHITSLVTLASNEGATCSYDADSAWGIYPGGDAMSTYRGLQFRFKLLCETGLGGTYHLTVHYSFEIWQMNYPYMYEESTCEVDQELTYEYYPTGYGDDCIWQQGYQAGQAGYGEFMEGHGPDNNYAMMYTRWIGDGTQSILHLNTQQSNQRDIYICGYSEGAENTVLTYVSQNNNNDWVLIGVNSTSVFAYNEMTPVGQYTGNFNYIAIVTLNLQYDNSPCLFRVDFVSSVANT
ncbi:MAG: hypothetical protein ACQCN4_09340 [Candidatus Bathyarchaeia archaeon]|jgi:hypothetical protein